MYSVRRQASNELVSLHIGNEHGYKAAVEEAMMRTQYSGKPHVVLDDLEKVQVYPGPIHIQDTDRSWARSLLERYFRG